MKYGNGTETYYDYERKRRRLHTLSVSSPNYAGAKIMDNDYTYDAVDNITRLVNSAQPQSGRMGGQMTHEYQYDEWYRLIGAQGNYIGADQKTANYQLQMQYDKLYNITNKQLNVSQTNVQFDGTLYAGHNLKYNYNPENPFQLVNIQSSEYRSETTPSDTVKRNNAYEYDKNGNLLSINADSSKKSRELLWDEENRLLSVNDNGFVSNYWYDAAGERVVKTSCENENVYVNGAHSGGLTNTKKFTTYINPYLVVSPGGMYTKHIYMGSQRIVSKIGDLESFGADPRRVVYAGHDVDGIETVDFAVKYDNVTGKIKERYKHFDLEYKGEENNDYVNGQGFCCTGGEIKEYETSESKDGENPERLMCFYHSDHLGSSSLITNFDVEVTQHVEYIPYGEVFIEERNNTRNTPYLFNAKELDEEIDLYYYGARYLNPMDGMWLSVDPMFEKYVGMSPYNYCAGNPVKLVDPDGRRPIYDPDGNLLGVTEDSGLHGDALFMNEEDYNHQMMEKDAQKKDLGIECLKTEGSQKNYKESFDNLKNRPDWDGYLTLEEANDWYKNGNGKPLYVSLDKIDLSGLVSLGEDFVGEEYILNLLFGASHKANDGLVYGNLTFKRYSNHTCRAFSDTYDFDIKPWSTKTFIRNVETLIGGYYAGNGVGYKINIYGIKTLKPKHHGLK